MSRSVILLLALLVGCGGAQKGVRPAHGQEELRSLWRVETQLGQVAEAGFFPVRVSGSPAPLRNARGGTAGSSAPREVLRLVPRGATTVAEAGGTLATGKALAAGGAVVAASGSVVLVCLTVDAARNGLNTPIDIADSFYGTHFGDIQGWVQSCFLPRSTNPRAGAAPVAQSSPGSEEQNKNIGRIYVTYTKLNSKTNRHYSGRTSMVIDLLKPLRPQAEQAVGVRDSNHHVDEETEPRGAVFRQAVLDVFDVGTAVDYANRYTDAAYWRIRGREQQLIDIQGGAQSDTREPHRTENVQRGVAKDNPLGRLFHDAATKKWGQLYSYTGD